MKFYAVCNANGPVSKGINAGSIDEAIQQFERMDSQSLIDNCSTDAEDDLGIEYAAGMDQGEFAETLESSGCESVRNLSEIVNGHSMRANNIMGGWVLWKKRVGKN